MRVCVFTNVGDTPWSFATVPSNAEYCLRHGYSLDVRRMAYDEALASQDVILDLLGTFDLVWAIDADCLITNHRQRIEEVPGLGYGATVCEEGMPWLSWNRLNCGSVVWRSTAGSRRLLRAMRDARGDWLDRARYPFWTQSWLAEQAERFADCLTILPPRAFNSVAWTQDGGGTTWQRGDLVYHPCCYPPEARFGVLAHKLQEVIR